MLRENDGFDKTTFGDGNVEPPHEEIGFANKFYTLWWVQPQKYKTIYHYVKNISFSKEKAFSLYPDAVFNEKLRGKSHTFTVSATLGGGYDERVRHFIPHYGLNNIGTEDGKVRIDNFAVKNSGIAYTRYNKPYYRFIGIDLDHPFESDFAVSIFEGGDNLPKKGDILSLSGVMSFYNENSDMIYLNDVTYEYVKRYSKENEAVEEGTKVDCNMILASIKEPVYHWDSLEKDGYIVFTNDNGEEFIVDTVVRDYKTGKPNVKIDTDSMSVGDLYHVKGTVKLKEGFYRLIRVKMELISKNTEDNDSESESNLNATRVFVKERTFDLNSGKIKGSKQYRFPYESIDEFFRYVISLKEDYGADCVKIIGKGEFGTFDELKKGFQDVIARSFENYYHVERIAVGLQLELTETDENVYYQILLIRDV